MATLNQLMTILSRNKISDEDRANLVFSWTCGRTTSARELRPDELQSIVKKFQESENTTPDMWRKRLIASIYGFLGKMNKQANPQLVKGIACIAGKKKHINDIPEQKLISLYNAFTTAQKDLDYAREMVNEFITDSQNYN